MHTDLPAVALIADCRSPALDCIRRWVRAAGLALWEVTEAAAPAAGRPPALVFVAGEGAGAASAAAQRWAGVPVVLVSDRALDAEARAAAFQAGVSDIFDRSPLRAEVLAKVRHAVAVAGELHTLRRRDAAAAAQVAACRTEREGLARALAACRFTVAHELRSPLRAVNGFAAMLEEEAGDALDPGAAALLGRVRGAAVRMNGLLDALAAYLDAAHPERALGPVDLAALVDELAAGLWRAQGRSPAEVVTGELPRVTGDAQALREVFRRLLDNALKFTRERAAVRVEVGCRVVDGELRCRVADNGVGFDEAYRERLFRPFQRLVHRHEFEGEGVGLAVVERIVQRLGGRVWAHGCPGVGAEFHFAVPLASGAAAPPPGCGCARGPRPHDSACG